MAMTINTNISSLNAQRNLGTSQTKLSQSIERLSSGLRINSAKDDAAGMAIATRMTTQVNGLNRAVQNANDGISLSQTTESALDEVTNNLQRIRELAVQSTNASNSDSDRAALDAEVQQRLSEVTRIATQTNFNGMKVLDGSANNLSFQVGANTGEVITVGLSQGMKANQVGELATGSATPVFSAAVAGTAGSTVGATAVTNFDFSGAGAKSFTVGGKTVNLNAAYADADAMTAAINTQLSGSGVTASQTAGAFTFTNNAVGAGSPVIGGTDGASLFGAQTATAGTDPVPSQLKVADGDLTFKVGDGAAFSISGTFKSTQDVADAINAKSGQGINAYVAQDGSLKFASAQKITVGGSKAAADGFTAGTVDVSAAKTLADSSVKTVDGANDTINRIDAALQSVSSLRSDLGAVQNRFESTISNLQNISQNLSSSRSAIQDADFAQETANMSSAQILQQAGVSVLAQANSSQQNVLKLLQ
ncbi:flagellin [Luteibacter sp. Sphag1AF]|uniref:flagellin N-terminal helical domain-containing protein n=1 Tax=Luteibacter sp. Sphag1AF TaxID=2587031 RepID=UPI001612735F|nr:flagellin [Luteibacter sp. Sphag1AF]MBB3225603.1 flagellin [Luteibacter sp. Sphag1AF]